MIRGTLTGCDNSYHIFDKALVLLSPPIQGFVVGYVVHRHLHTSISIEDHRLGGFSRIII